VSAAESTTRTVAPAPRTVVAPPDQSLVRVQWVVALTAAALLVLAAARLWFVAGLWRRVTIEGPSMAPALCGPYFELTCGDCGFAFRCDAEHVPQDGRATCPNCGFVENRLTDLRQRPAERVLIDGWPLAWRGARRGEVVAARAPDPPGEPVVKRVAAVGPQRLGIRDGELYADEQLVRKTRGELREIRILVHDNDSQPQKTTSLAPRWRAASGDSRWRSVGRTGMRIDQTAEPGGPLDWLQYHHWHCTANPLLPRDQDCPILDNDSYNQGETRRPLNPVSDVLLSCRLRAKGKGRLGIAVSDGGERWEIVIEPRRWVVVNRGDQKVLERPLEMNLSRREIDVEFGLCDQQVLLVVEGRTLVRLQYEPAAGPRPEVLHPLAIGASGLEVKVSHLRVWRDNYYLDPQGLPRPWEAAAPLPENHVVLLGDNQPVSIDSRQWENPAVPRGAILGRVYRPFWAAF
jgi:Signal peptidase, peptidase S26